MRVVDNVLKLIGNTPLIRLNYFSSAKVEILAKVESFNPGGSVKDRAALYMIEGAEKRGELIKDKVILEATSGNTGIGLALVGAVKRYKVKIVLPESMSMERRQLLKAYGAEIVLSPADKGTDGAIELAEEIYRSDPDKYYMPNQFDNPDNVRAHYETTGPEIIAQTAGKLDAFVAGIGTSGTLMGAGKRLKEFDENIMVVGVEPPPKHNIQGLKSLEDQRVPKIYDPSLPDKVLRVTDEEAFELVRLLPKKEGLFVGISSAAALCGALKIAEQMDKGRIVVIFPDGGDRYLSLGLF
ncbi:PLP-dependent cysteine synthase family protein [Thermosulfidibacter takaii]|nr:cysteine synthase family protein [Thermosulfidibacter takaii]